MSKLSANVAFVTGGSRGIGAAIVGRLAAEGADVTFTYANSADAAAGVEEKVRAVGGKARAVQVDSTDIAALRGAIRDTARAHGRFDVLVNSAGTFLLSNIHEAGDEAFDRMIGLNVRPVYAAANEASKRMIRAGNGGRIVTIGSINGDTAPFPGISFYAMSKAAVAALTRGWARDLGSHGITVNNVQPGPIDTEMNPADGDFGEMMKAMTAIGRYGRPEEVASAVAFLAGDEASNITGVSLNVDGGWRT